jgi:TIR domain
MLESQQ